MRRKFLKVLLIIVLVTTSFELKNGISIVINEENYAAFLEKQRLRRLLRTPQEFDLRDSSNRAYVNKNSDIHHVVTVTTYNPVPEQCWGDPLITADRHIIDTVALRNGKLKWCAVSPNLQDKYPMGTKIKVTIGKKVEYYEIHDLTAERYIDYVDLLYPEGKMGKWKNVLITKVED